jgi:hypothetical protein
MTAAAVLLPGRQGQRHAECYDEEDEKEGWADGPHFRRTSLTECEKTTRKKERTPPVDWALDLHQPRHQQQQLKRTMSEELLVALRKLQHSLDSPPMPSMTHQHQHRQQSSLPQEIDELIYKEEEEDVSADNLVGCHPLLAQQQTYLQRYHTHNNARTSFSPPSQLLSPLADMNPGIEILFPPPLPFFLSGGCCVPHLLATTRN